MITDRDIARWRLHSQLLAAPAGAAEDVVRTLTAVQAENASQSAWAVATRAKSPEQGDLAAALADGRVLRIHVLRSTWHYVHADDALWLQELTAPRVMPIFEQQLQPIAGRLGVLGDAIEKMLAESPDRTRGDLAEGLAERGEPLTGQQLMLLLGRLEVQSLVCSGAPRDGEHTYARFADRVPSPRRLDRDEALAELALRYFTSHGPATDRDLAYWATLTVTDVRRGIAAAGDRLDSFEHEGRTFWHAPGEAPASAAPAGHLLQVLDEMYRGYQDSRWIIDADGVVPRAREAAIGMALVDGQLVAGMKRTVTTKAVTFAVHPHRALTTREVAAVDDAAARYGTFLGLEARVRLEA
ncbi:winged helix DNA-binding domain-containing protein [Agromyces cerinus]|uniref:Winged helix DNA-binding domain-containing protein n=1 Tax=Agromyces cerinus subsp. cerinus TaxID=232089 RepID=A0A1N6I5Y8_9MICO|nr:winged helix DNA-binding domain-containing protein [Agromyces cerinus]SIO27447.1 Winged helix DNA-binding domain-containing protein [Agromyces cerinus subsp. cerinus]